MYGYLDESGAPGVANRPCDYLIVSLVIFPDKESSDKCSAAIYRLRKRQNLKGNYEFHFSHNAVRHKDAFVKLISNLEFQFITVAIRKDATHKLASYAHVAELLLPEIARHAKDIHILMDSNPILCSKLKKRAKDSKLYGVRFKQAKSHTDNLLQLADYIAALCARKAKNPEKEYASFRAIAKKQWAFLEITA